MTGTRDLLRIHLDAVGEFRILGPLPPPRRTAPTQTQIRVSGVEAGRRFTVAVLDREEVLQRIANVEPFLFEQTNYQFELGLVGDQRGPVQLRMRGRNLLDGHSPIRGHAVYCVPVNFGSAIGFTEIELWCGGMRRFCIRVEVFPTKLDYRHGSGCAAGRPPDGSAGPGLCPSRQDFPESSPDARPTPAGYRVDRLTERCIRANDERIRHYRPFADTARDSPGGDRIRASTGPREPGCSELRPDSCPSVRAP